jgi:hypothetical protein
LPGKKHRANTKTAAAAKIDNEKRKPNLLFIGIILSKLISISSQLPEFTRKISNITSVQDQHVDVFRLFL